MPTPYSAEDLRALFEPRTLTRGRSLVLLGAVEVALDGDSITAAVADGKERRTARLTPTPRGTRVGFGMRCSCRMSGCAHVAAAGLAGLDRFPALRRPVETLALDAPGTAARPTRRLLFDVAPASPPFACIVTAFLLDEANGRRSSAP
jgi:hypothetical protein